MAKHHDRINDKLRGLSAPIDKEALWSRIETHQRFPARSGKGGLTAKNILLFFIGLVVAWASNPAPEWGSVAAPIPTMANEAPVKALPYWFGKRIATVPREDVGRHSADVDRKKEFFGVTKPKHRPIAEQEVTQLPVRATIPKSVNEQNAGLPSPHSIGQIPSKEPGQIYIRSVKLDSIAQILPLKMPQWRAYIGMGIGYTAHQVEGQPARPQEHYTQTLESYTFELGVARQLGKQWEASIGLQYTRDYRRFRYTQTDTIVQQGGQVARERQYQLYQSYQYFDAQAAISRQFTWGAYTLATSAGLQANLLFNVEGRQLDPDGKLTTVDTDQSYRKHLAPRFLGRLQVRRAVGTNMEAFAGLTYLSTVSLHQNSAALKHRAASLFLKTGISYRF